ncbi:MAG: hypothetical protein R3C52_09700 [Hyphomonadaceae bacterium]
MRSALAQAACSHRVREAEAWVNFMSGGGRNGRNLNVLAKLADPGAAALLIRSSASTPEMLVLEVRTADEAPILGQMSYREAAPEPLYRRISLTCRGGEIFAITAIERVY